jgi:hypothetical protein
MTINAIARMTSIDRAHLAAADVHLDEILEVVDDLRRLEPTGVNLHDLLARAELHARAAQDEIDNVRRD